MCASLCIPVLSHAMARSKQAGGGGLPRVTGENLQPPASPPGPQALICREIEATSGPKGSVTHTLPSTFLIPESGVRSGRGLPSGSSRFPPVMGRGEGGVGRWPSGVGGTQRWGNVTPSQEIASRGAVALPRHSLSIPILATSATGRMTLDRGAGGGTQPEISDRWEGGGVDTPDRAGGRGSLPWDP